MTQNNCKKCNTEFAPKKGLINFCSIQCKNSRDFSSKTRTIKRDITKRKWEQGMYENLDWYEINNREDKKEKTIKTWKDKYENKLMEGEKLHIQTIKKILMNKVNSCCEICGIFNWLENKISLEIHHIDGNNKNNNTNNLQILCPNCHSQTDNYRTKNIKREICNQ